MGSGLQSGLALTVNLAAICLALAFVGAIVAGLF